MYVFLFENILGRLILNMAPIFYFQCAIGPILSKSWADHYHLSTFRDKCFVINVFAS